MADAATANTAAASMFAVVRGSDYLQHLRRWARERA
jgi:hypothetical protein